MSTAAATQTARPKPQTVGAATGDLKAAFSELLQTGIGTVAAKVSKTVDGSVDKLQTTSEPLGVTSDDGSAMNAGAEAAQASAQGKSPVWGAIKGAWSGASTKTKVVLGLIAVLVVLGLVLSPVLLLLLLIVLGIIAAVRAASR